MLTKKLFQQLLLARGLTAEQIVQRTGIPAKSLDVLIGRDDSEGKDPNKLISQSTFEKVLQLLGIAADNKGLRSTGVLVWAYKAKSSRQLRSQWRDAVANVRKTLLSDEVTIAELHSKKGFLSPRQYIMLLHDRQHELCIGIVGLDKVARDFLVRATGSAVERSEQLNQKEFALHRSLIENGVYRRNYFAEIMAGRKKSYDWDDVKAAAKEFNFTPEAIINVMLAEVRRKEEAEKLDDVPVLHDAVPPSIRRIG